MRITICDDDPDSAEEWKDRISAAVGNGHEVFRLPNPVAAIEQLVERKKLATVGKPFDAAVETAFDGIDVLVVDYDLIHIDQKGSRTTGEGVARLARVYSCCRYVIVLNQFARVDFDLGMIGNLASFADVNVFAGLVGEPALWLADAADDFRPSYWHPTIPLVEERKAFLAENPDILDRRVLEFLGLKSAELHGISDAAFAYLSPEVQHLEDLEAVTVLQVLKRLLGELEADGLVASSREMASAFAVSRLAKWLDRAMLRPLDALTDAAHLAERRPYLLEAKAAELADAEFWVSLRGKEAERLTARVPETAQLPLGKRLLARSVYVTARLEQVQGIDKLSDEFDYSILPDTVFAEDTSRFVQRKAAEEFRAGFNNFSDRRYVERLAGRNYGPQRRFAFGD